jgi:hypothetical protein
LVWYTHFRLTFVCVCGGGGEEGEEYMPAHRLCLMFVVVISLISTTDMLKGYLDHDATVSFQIRSVSSSTSAVYSKTLSVSQIKRINPLNAELNPICCLLALLGAHHFLHISRIRVKLLTLRLLILYIYDISSLRVK